MNTQLPQPPNLLLLMPPALAGEALAAATGFGQVRAVQTLPQLLEALDPGPWHVLLSFGTGVIVPADVLARPGLHAFNIHAASPAYPGRDPHHFAAYDGVAEYGATLHAMTAVVDQGPVLAVELAAVAADATPRQLLALANACGMRLLRHLLATLAAGALPAHDPSLAWRGPVRRRRDFVALCRVDAGMPPAEFARRLHACSMPPHANLWTEIHGRRFVLELPQ